MSSSTVSFGEVGALDPFLIGIVGTVIALLIVAKAVRTIKQSSKGRGLMVTYIGMAVTFIGVIWFIILRLMPSI